MVITNMKSGINLINKQDTESTVSEEKFRRLRIIAVVFLFGIAFFAITLSFLIALSPLPRLRQQEAVAQRTVAQYHTEIAQLFLIHDRLQSITQIIHDRPTFEKMIALIKSYLSSDMNIISYSMNAKSVSFTVSSLSLVSLNTFIEQMRKEAGSKKLIKQVALADVSTDEFRDAFFITITLTL
jgi:hypothetical protein